MTATSSPPPVADHTAKPAGGPYVFVDELKTQFPLPKAVALDRGGNLYVGCSAQGGLQKFVRTNHAGKFTPAWIVQRHKDGYSVLGLAVERTGNVFATVRTKNSREVQQFSAAGTFVNAWGSIGTLAGQFCSPNGIALDREGNLYIAESSAWGTGSSHRVQKFTLAGKFLATWGTEGSGDGQFNLPVGIALDGRGNVYVADTYNSRVQKFTPDGRFLGKWGSYGYEPGQLDCPQGIALDRAGNVYLADTYNNRVQKFTSDGKLLAHWGRQGTEHGQFWLPCAVAVDEGDMAGRLRHTG
ncbi:MAG: SMP-30/gluconolactonase/LRE family protein [Thermoguttaceae bacterium]|jgi:DNA-binding beta-propeller fold protein YncE